MKNARGENSPLFPTAAVIWKDRFLSLKHNSQQVDRSLGYTRRQLSEENTVQGPHLQTSE